MGRKPDQGIVNKKRTYRLEEFAVFTDPKVKFKDNKNIYKYLQIASELKKQLWNMKMTVIPRVDSLHITILKNLVNELKEFEIAGPSNLRHC